LAFGLAIKRVDGRFIPSPHLAKWTYRLQYKARTATIAPRFHLKSTVALGYIAWKLFRMDDVYNEYSFMSYRGDLAGYHLKRLKRYIGALPECFQDYRNTTQSDIIVAYTKDGKDFVCEPEGVLVFKRGKHPKEMICDDILRDPETHMDLSQLEKIKRTFFEEVEQMPKDALHIVGTPQDREDLFYALSQTPTYDVKSYPAIHPVTGKALWEEYYPLTRLAEIRATIGDKAFRKEFLCEPVRSTEAFISMEELAQITNKELRNYDMFDNIEVVNSVAGFDIGKKAHPSHLSVFSMKGKKLIQIHSKFLDGWNYTDQIAYLRQAIKKFNIQSLKYDNSRAEFEECAERGDLPAEMSPVSFTAKHNFTLATEFDRAITNREIELIDDERQKRQILSLDCDLQAPVTQDGHGDSFWSLCLAIQAYRECTGEVAWIV
jgi:hypothetical protein